MHNCLHIPTSFTLARVALTTFKFHSSTKAVLMSSEAAKGMRGGILVTAKYPIYRLINSDTSGPHSKPTCAPGLSDIRCGCCFRTVYWDRQKVGAYLWSPQWQCGVHWWGQNQRSTHRCRQQRPRTVHCSSDKHHQMPAKGPAHAVGSSVITREITHQFQARADVMSHVLYTLSINSWSGTILAVMGIG